MKRVLNLFPILAVLGLLFFSAFFSVAACADTPEKTIVSRTAEIDGVKLRYTTGGHGPALILLHGYAETSRMWTPRIPANGLDMKTAAIRIHALARSLGVPEGQSGRARHRPHGRSSPRKSRS